MTSTGVLSNTNYARIATSAQSKIIEDLDVCEFRKSVISFAHPKKTPKIKRTIR